MHPLHTKRLANEARHAFLCWKRVQTMVRSILSVVRWVSVSMCVAIVHPGRAQSSSAQPEFPAGWRFPVTLSQGFVGKGEFYAGSATIAALYTVVPGSLRAGAVAGPALVVGQLRGMGGVHLAWRVKTFNTSLGSWGNGQLVAEHLWLTNEQALLGGGVVVEAGELVLVGLKGYWSYQPQSDRHPGWFQFSMGLNVFKKKPTVESNDPFSNP
jgi:hypothetical protein